MGHDIRTLHAAKLRHYRRMADKKQVEVAIELDMSQQSYSLLENGKTWFTDEIIDSICKYFDITPAQFETPEQQVTVASYNTNNTHSNNSIDEKLVDTLISLREQNQELMEFSQRVMQELIAEKDARIKDLEARDRK